MRVGRCSLYVGAVAFIIEFQGSPLVGMTRVKSMDLLTQQHDLMETEEFFLFVTTLYDFIITFDKTKNW